MPEQKKKQQPKAPLRIVVCVKQVPADNQVLMDPETNTIIREGAEAIINPFDAFAIEEALRLKERCGAETAAISMGIPSVKELLREVIALGIDSACLLSDRAFAGADTLATAYALMRGIEKLGGADLIICGKMATDGDTAQVGPMLAEMLGRAQLTDVSAIEEITETALVCRKLTDDGYQRRRIPLPALITVVKEINVPRLPSISGLFRGQEAEIPVFSAADINADSGAIGLSGSPTQVVRTFTPERKVAGEKISGNSREQAAALLAHMRELKLLEN